MERVDLLIENCTILPLNGKIIEKGTIAIKEGIITYVGKPLEFKAEVKIDASKFLAMPGLINTHTHAPMTIFRGVSEDKGLKEWLERTIWPLEAKLTFNDVYTGALLACLEMIKSGTTCFADMYHYEEAVAKAVKESGMRAVLSAGFFEVGDPEKGKEGLKRSVNFASKFHGYANGRIITMLGPHAVYSCSPELLLKTKEEADRLKVGIHIHLAESKEMVELVKEMHGYTEVELLERIGFLSSNILAAHCIHLTDKEIEILAKRGVKVSYNPVSNMKVALGIPKIYELIKAGIIVGIGTDGPASNNNLDLFDDLRIGALLQKAFYNDPRVLPAKDVLRMATIEGSKALGIDRLVGSLRKGKRADIILINKRAIEVVPIHDLYASLVYSASGGCIDTVIIDGKIVMQNREVKTLNEKKVIEMAEKVAFDIISR